MKKMLPIAAAIILTGCANEIVPKQFIGPNNRTAYSMDCGRDITKCYEMAGKICRGGYDIIDSNSRTNVVSNPSTGQVIAVTRRSLAIECK